MKKKRKKTNKISIEDYIKAIKKTDREIQLEASPGWVASSRVHKSKKQYDRQRDRKVNLNE